MDNYDDNVVEWISDLSRLMRICNIESKNQIFKWALETVGSVSKRELKNLVKRAGNSKNDDESYPSLKEIQKAVEKV